MGLKDKLNQMKEGFKAKAPKEAQDIMRRAAEELKNSGIMERAVKIGDKAPDYTERPEPEDTLAALKELGA
jgi:ATP/maltotriose-dependent transcriptional regulator MalT